MEHCYNLHITSSFTELSISDIVVSDFVHLADEANIFWLLLLNNSRKTLLLWDWYFFGQNILLFSYILNIFLLMHLQRWVPTAGVPTLLWFLSNCNQKAISWGPDHRDTKSVPALQNRIISFNLIQLSPILREAVKSGGTLQILLGSDLFDDSNFSNF